MGLVQRIDVTLVAPPAQGRRTGGFLVNRELSRSPNVRLRETTDDLDRALGEIDDAIVVDSIYLNDPHACRILLARAAERSIVLLAHSLPSLIPGFPVRDRTAALRRERALIRRFAGAVAPSGFMRDALVRRGARPASVAVIEPAPVCDGRLAHRSEHRRIAPLRVLTVANHGESKGILDAALAIRDLPPGLRTSARLRWTLIGSPATDDAYESTLRLALGRLGSVITNLPAMEPQAIAAHYGGADLFLLPSVMESYGIVVAEAITFGVPVLAPHASAIPDTAGAALWPLDFPVRASISRSIADLIRDDGERGRLESLRASALERAEAYPRWDAVRSEFVASIYSLRSKTIA